MTIIREEALKERARKLYTVPPTIEKSRLDAIAEPCRIELKGFYNLVGDTYVIKAAISDAEKFRILECLKYLNGFRMIEVSLKDGYAVLTVHFYNRNYFDKIIKDYDKAKREGAQNADNQFPITGGVRILGGPAEDQVKVVEIIDLGYSTSILQLKVKPIGDYSTYTLGIKTEGNSDIDPVFNEIKFKFRPGCFNTDCRPEWEAAPRPGENPVIDYLARDYDSFRHVMMSAMAERVPGWQPTSEADLDQVLLELFSVAADELSDYQDRVMNEAYLATARKRVSLARHGRLMDYHIHQGNQASSWVALRVADGKTVNLKPDFEVATDRNFDGERTIVFSCQGLFYLGEGFKNELDNFRISDRLRDKFKLYDINLSSESFVDVSDFGSRWEIIDDENKQVYLVVKDGDHLAVFVDWYLNYLLNDIKLHTWSDSKPALKAGATQADLLIADGKKETDAESVCNAIRGGKVKHLLLQEWLNPSTGKPPGANPGKRQLLKLLSGDEAVEKLHDLLEDKWIVRVKWRDEYALENDYCFSIDCPPDKTHDDVSMFHGNLIKVYHGRARECIFKAPGESLDSLQNEYHYERTGSGSVICRLPDKHLAYRETESGGLVPPESTLEVSVISASGVSDKYDEVISLIHSDDSDEMGDHFVVETDESGHSLVRFGNGINGKRLPEKAVVNCKYRAGIGPDGNIGSDRLICFPEYYDSLIDECWNPFDITNGRAPEPVAEIIRRVPEAYIYRQLRAVTLKDYVDRAEELEEVQRAYAAYSWTGSWRTVRITIDPRGGTELTETLSDKLASHLDAVRLIGEDLEIRPPRFVPLDITVELCVHPDFWPEDIKYLLEQEFSDGWTPGGRPAFFNPDLWTFGQGLMKSQIIGRVQMIEGVDHVKSVIMKRFNEPTPGFRDRIEIGPTEIIQVKNDPDQMEAGIIRFDLKGGRS